MKQAQWLMDTLIGPLYLVASETGLQSILTKKNPRVALASSLRGESSETKNLALGVRQLEEYFKGERREFDLPCDVEGTEFQMRVWRELSQIPFGATCSYGDIARKLRKEKAVRAVGAANGKNPLCIVVPCHRVIGANGSLTGYAGGLTVKGKLLEHERSLTLRD